MPTIEEFTENFHGHEIPHELLLLLEFQDKSGTDIFSVGFELACNFKEGLSYRWSKDPDFLNDLFPFAIANRSGSFYAFWNKSASSQLMEMPIVLFDVDGGEHIVAEDLSQLLQILTYDAEPTVDQEAVRFPRDAEQYKPSPKLDQFKTWIKETFNVDEVENPELIVRVAQEKHQQSFNDWKVQYLEAC
jgi:hypothetical protein